MILTELALQGIRGFPALLRLPLMPGLNLIQSSDSARRSSILDALYHTLYPDPARGSATAALKDLSRPESRIALTLHGRDDIVYRVFREAETGAMHLVRFGAQSRQFESLTTVSQEVAQYLRVQERLPDESTYERLFLFDGASMPSLGRKARSRSGAALFPRVNDGIAPSAPGLPPLRPHAQGGAPRGASPAPRGISNAWSADPGRGPAQHPAPDEMRARDDEGPSRDEEIAHLEQQLAQARLSLGAQAELDALQKRKSEVEAKVEALDKAQREEAALSAEADAASVLRGLSPSALERIQRFDDTRRKHDEEADKLQAEISELESVLDSQRPEPVWRDRYFVAGLAGAAGSVLLAALLGRPAVLLLNIPGVIVAAAGGFRWVGHLEQRSRVEARLIAARDRLQRLKKQFDLDMSTTSSLMRKLGAEEPRDLLDRLERLERVDEQLDEARAKARALASDPAVEAASAELERIRTRIEECEAILMGAGHVPSVETLERKLSGRRPSRDGAGGSRVVRPQRSPPSSPRDDALFDFTGGAIGASDGEEVPDDDGEDVGYGVGYGSFSGSSSATEKNGLDSRSFGTCLLAASGGRGFGSGSRGGSYGAYGESSGKDSSLGPDRSRDLMQAAVDLLQVDVEALAQTIGPRLGQYLQALTDGEFRSASFGPRGEVRVRPAASDDEIEYTELGGEALDMVDTSIRFALLERVLEKIKVPVLVDDPFGAMPAPRRKLFGQMLTYFGQAAQVIVLTAAADLPGRPVLLEDSRAPSAPRV